MEARSKPVTVELVFPANEMHCYATNPEITLICAANPKSSDS
jgi:hypothetical protein